MTLPAMCSNYEALLGDQITLHYGVSAPQISEFGMWPEYQGTVLRRPPKSALGDEAVAHL